MVAWPIWGHGAGLCSYVSKTLFALVPTPNILICVICRLCVCFPHASPRHKEGGICYLPPLSLQLASAAATRFFCSACFEQCAQVPLGFGLCESLARNRDCYVHSGPFANLLTSCSWKRAGPDNVSLMPHMLVCLVIGCWCCCLGDIGMVAWCSPAAVLLFVSTCWDRTGSGTHSASIQMRLSPSCVMRVRMALFMLSAFF